MHFLSPPGVVLPRPTRPGFCQGAGTTVARRTGHYQVRIVHRGSSEISSCQVASVIPVFQPAAPGTRGRSHHAFELIT